MRLACYARSSWTASFLLWVFLAGPADAGNPPPAGFVEACYGGSFKASHAGGRAIKAYHIDADQRSWDEMRSLFRQIAQEFELSFFDTSPDMDHIKGLEIHLCSAGRFWIEARQWDWLQGAFAGEEVGPVRISAAPYGDRSGWQAVSARLEQGLYATWGKRVTVAWDDQ